MAHNVNAGYKLPFAMNALFYVKDFRDRDFWPVAMSFLRRGHKVYYTTARRTPWCEVPSLQARHGFEIILTSDGVLVTKERLDWLSRLPGRPIIVELIFNNLHELVSRFVLDYPADSCERANVFLAVMDGELVSAAARCGVPEDRLIHLPYRLPQLQVTDPRYWVRRMGNRLFGMLEPGDLEAQERPIQRALAVAAHVKSGLIPRPRTTEITFLGECSISLDLPFLEWVRARFIPTVPVALLVETNGRIAVSFEGRPTRAFLGAARATWTETLTISGAGDRQRFMALELLLDRCAHRFRTRRRRRFVEYLASAFGKRLKLYGDDFVRLGLRALPTDHGSTEYKYLTSKIAVDLGSKCYDCSLYTRSSRIVSCGALLLQFRQDDAERTFGSLTAAVTFTEAEEMIARVEHFLSSPFDRRRTSSDVVSLASTGQGLDFVVDELVARLCRRRTAPAAMTPGEHAG